MGFLSFMSDVGTGIADFFGGPIKAIESAIDGKPVGQVLGEAFVPGYAVYTGLKEKHSTPEWVEQSSKSDAQIIKETWENVGDLDLDNDGVTVSDHIDKLGSFAEKVYGVDIPYVGDEKTDNVESSDYGFNILGLVIPASIIGFLFLL